MSTTMLPRVAAMLLAAVLPGAAPASASRCELPPPDPPTALGAHLDDASSARMRVLERDWQAEVIDALLHRGDAEGRAAAAMLAEVLDRPDLPTSAAQFEPGPQTSGAARDRSVALRTQALLEADALSYPMLRMLVLQWQTRADAPEREMLGNALTARSPGDHTGWLIRLDALRAQDATEQDIDALLAQAATAVTGTEPWFHDSVRRLDAAFAEAPAPAELQALVWDSLGGPASDTADLPPDVPGLLASIGIAMALATPGFVELGRTCGEVATAPDHAPRRRACLQLARALGTESPVMIDRMIGLGIWHRLARGRAEESVVIAAKRQYHWLHQQYIASQDGRCASDWARLAAHIRNGNGDELDALRAALDEAGVSDRPPTGWLPSNPAVLDAR
jgi:hypothetical protein